jgi:hypothetical protein
MRLRIVFINQPGRSYTVITVTVTGYNVQTADARTVSTYGGGR